MASNKLKNMSRPRIEACDWRDAPITNEGRYRVFNYPNKDNTPKVWIAERQDGDRYAKLEEDTIMRLYRGSLGKIQEETEALAGELQFDTDPAYPWK